MRGKYEKSCGIIPFRKIGRNRKYLLVQNIGGHWEFPKGHQEKGETDRGTARREFFEETGLKTKRVFGPAFFEHYFFTWKGKRKSKKVYYFLGEAAMGEVKIQAEEIVNHAWLTYRAALKKLTYKEVREILRQAEKIVAEKLKSDRS